MERQCCRRWWLCRWRWWYWSSWPCSQVLTAAKLNRKLNSLPCEWTLNTSCSGNVMQATHTHTTIPTHNSTACRTRVQANCYFGRFKTDLLLKCIYRCSLHLFIDYKGQGGSVPAEPPSPPHPTPKSALNSLELKTTNKHHNKYKKTKQQDKSSQLSACSIQMSFCKQICGPKKRINLVSTHYVAVETLYKKLAYSENEEFVKNFPM